MWTVIKPQLLLPPKKNRSYQVQGPRERVRDRARDPGMDLWVGHIPGTIETWEKDDDAPIIQGFLFPVIKLG